MRLALSIYLDILRVIAAMTVFLSHWSYFGGSLPALHHYDHQAVIVFFVISGYVIAYVTDTRCRISSRSFALSRTTRIYSVAIPALVLSAAVAWSVGQSGYQLAQPWKYVPLFLAFGTEWWSVREEAFGNTPYWSLGYEVWYYVLFACFTFLVGRARMLLCVAVLLLPLASGSGFCCRYGCRVCGSIIFTKGPNGIGP